MIRVNLSIKETSYSGNVFYGSLLGLFPIPDGFSKIDPNLKKGNDGLYYAQEPTIGAHSLLVLEETDLGPRTYTP